MADQDRGRELADVIKRAHEGYLNTADPWAAIAQDVIESGYRAAPAETEAGPTIVRTGDEFDRVGEGDPLIPCEENGTPRVHGEVVTRTSYLGEWEVAKDDAPFLVLAASPPTQGPAETEAGDRITDWPERPSNAAIARMFHEEYERLAPLFGYRTRDESAKPWDEVPETNRLLMGATVGGVMVRLFGDAPDDPLAATPPAPEGEADELGHVREGDPDPTPDAFESDTVPCSAARSRPMGPFCTRPEGHPGQHLAGGGYATGIVHAVWPAATPAPAGPQAEGAGETAGGEPRG